jgi:hypothetical protein
MALIPASRRAFSRVGRIAEQLRERDAAVGTNGVVNVNNTVEPPASSSGLHWADPRRRRTDAAAARPNSCIYRLRALGRAEASPATVERITITFDRSPARDNLTVLRAALEALLALHRGRTSPLRCVACTVGERRSCTAVDHSSQELACTDSTTLGSALWTRHWVNTRVASLVGDESARDNDAAIDVLCAAARCHLATGDPKGAFFTLVPATGLRMDPTQLYYSVLTQVVHSLDAELLGPRAAALLEEFARARKTFVVDRHRLWFDRAMNFLFVAAVRHGGHDIDAAWGNFEVLRRSAVAMPSAASALMMCAARTGTSRDCLRVLAETKRAIARMRPAESAETDRDTRIEALYLRALASCRGSASARDFCAVLTHAKETGQLAILADRIPVAIFETAIRCEDSVAMQAAADFVNVKGGDKRLQDRRVQHAVARCYSQLNQLDVLRSLMVDYGEGDARDTEILGTALLTASQRF